MRGVKHARGWKTRLFYDEAVSNHGAWKGVRAAVFFTRRGRRCRFEKVRDLSKRLGREGPGRKGK